jgi:hypothetical protein
MKKIFLYTGLVLFNYSCKKDAQSIIQSYELEAFNHVVLFDSFNTILHESDEFRIEIKAAASRQEFIKFSVTDSTLEVRNEKVAGWSNPYINEIELHIYSEPLSLVEVAESGLVSTANPITSEEFGIILKNKVNEANLELDCGTFYFWNNEPAGGKLTLTGHCGVVKVWNHALMSVDAKHLTSEVALIENRSKGTVEVSPTQRLEYSILDVGDIFLFSNPTEIIEIENSGEGNLVLF